MSKKLFDTIRDGINRDVYRCVRLVKINDKGDREMLLTYTKIGATKEQALHRLSEIKFHLEKKLPVGNYVIDARRGSTKNSLTDSFPYEVKSPVTIQLHSSSENKNDPSLPIEDKTTEQQSMREIDFDDYKALIEENANLKAVIKILEHKLELAQTSMPLAENKETTTGSAILQTLSDNLPTAMAILDKYFTQKDKQHELKERELSLAENGSTTSFKKKKKILRKSNDDILSEMEALYDQDENVFNDAMDNLFNTNPGAYNYVWESMGLEEEGEEEEEDQI